LLIAANFPSPGLQDLPDYVMEKPVSALGIKGSSFILMAIRQRV
jgi:hypothetical protein